MKRRNNAQTVLCNVYIGIGRIHMHWTANRLDWDWWWWWVWVCFEHICSNMNHTGIEMLLPLCRHRRRRRRWMVVCMCMYENEHPVWSTVNVYAAPNLCVSWISRGQSKEWIKKYIKYKRNHMHAHTEMLTFKQIHMIYTQAHFQRRTYISKSSTLVLSIFQFTVIVLVYFK